MSKQCQVCSEVTAKYKCPKCSVKYCSVTCYKQHKENCKVTEPNPTKSRPDASSRLQEPKEEGELSDSELDGVTEDKVDRKVLEKLRESSELKALLGNPHLQVMMSALAEAEDPGKLMEAAMKEPIFTEFADECLKIVEPLSDET